MADEELWKTRFLTFMLVRIAGVATFLLGVAIAYSDLVRDGGWPMLGGVIAIMGVIDAVFAPRLLKRLWDEQDRERR